MMKTTYSAIALDLDIFFVTGHGCTHCGADTWQEGVRWCKSSKPHALCNNSLSWKERKGVGREESLPQEARKTAHYFLQNIANNLLVKGNTC